MDAQISVITDKFIVPEGKYSLVKDARERFLVKSWTFKWHYLIIYKPTPQPEIVRVLSGFRDIINLIG